MKRIHFAVATLITSLAASNQTIAARQERAHVQTAVADCQAALPVFDGALRKRPLAIINQSKSIAFISCSISTETFSSQGITEVDVIMTNRNAEDVDVSCTLIAGLGAEIEPTVFLPRVLTLGAGPDFLSWDSESDNGGTRFGVSSIQCALPPGVEINATASIYDTDVGI